MHDTGSSDDSAANRMTPVGCMLASSSPAYAPPASVSHHTNPLFEEAHGADRDNASHASYSLSSVSSSDALGPPASADRERAASTSPARSSTGSQTDLGYRVKEPPIGGSPQAASRPASESGAHWWDVDGLIDSCSDRSATPPSPHLPGPQHDAPFCHQGSGGHFDRGPGRQHRGKERHTGKPGSGCAAGGSSAVVGALRPAHSTGRDTAASLQPAETAAAAAAAVADLMTTCEAVADLMDPCDLMVPLGPSADEGRLHARLSALRVALRRAENALQDKVRLKPLSPKPSDLCERTHTAHVLEIATWN